MAITWNIGIGNVNEAAKRADVTFKRTDTESTLAPMVYSFSNVIIETTAQRAALLEQVKAEVIKDEQKNANIKTFLSNLVQTGISALETWEANR